MRAALRAAVILALVLTVPMQSFAASVLQFCQVALSTSNAARVTRNVDTSGSKSIEASARPLRADTAVSPHTAAAKHAQHAKHKKWDGRSNACCFAALVPTQRQVDFTPAGSIYAGFDLTPRGGLTPDVLERPPRA